jgi:hydrogenase maturation protein HypF
MAMKRELIRLTLDLRGVVQGVGFRPTLARLAAEDGVAGSVQNRSGAVRLVVEAERDVVERFLASLPARLPSQARLDEVSEISRVVVPPGQALRGFEIAESTTSGSMRISIPADLAICRDCMREVLDPKSRFFGYPFTTCTSCGPRYTVVEGMPYDRERTALKAFPLCPTCRAEYEDPRDRRFHAESIACPVCGPRLSLLGAGGAVLPEASPLRAARRAIRDGAIVAVRGLGGFLLAADPFDAAALARLRALKARPHKPLAVMARDLATAARYCRVTAAAALLESPIAPIAILDADREACAAAGLALELLAPGTSTLGVMLPTSPLHLLLAEPLPGDPVARFELLVMTSGNRRGEPICTANDEALERLAGIADLYLCHDREIALRADDSVCAEISGAMRVIRRARGYAPTPIRLGAPLARTVLAMGAELKNAIALGFGDEVVLSPHIGDLETPEALDGLLQVVRVFPAYFAKDPEVVAVDLHPDMHATRVGRELAARLGVPAAGVQHHHAHAAACMAEHGVREALALVFDGTGYGTDGAIWGGELLHVTPTGFTREGTFAGVPLPGGDAAVRRPARQAVARLLAQGVEVDDRLRDRLGVSEAELAAIRYQCGGDALAPKTHAVGRAFDAFAALVGVAPSAVTYEGQAAVLLEAAARAFLERGGSAPELPYAVREVSGMAVADLGPLFAEVAAAPAPAGRAGELAAGFHRAVAGAAIELVRRAVGAKGISTVALSGGAMLNRILVDQVVAGLHREGYITLLHRAVPPGDGGIALGQAVVAGGVAGCA